MTGTEQWHTRIFSTCSTEKIINSSPIIRVELHLR